MDETAAHRKRIRRLKKMILGTVTMAILIPIVICIILGVRVAVLSDKTKELTAQLEEERNKPKFKFGSKKKPTFSFGEKTTK